MYVCVAMHGYGCMYVYHVCIHNSLRHVATYITSSLLILFTDVCAGNCMYSNVLVWLYFKCAQFCATECESQ